MKHRHKVRPSKSRKMFRNSALNTKTINLSTRPRRGGIRM